MGVIGAGRMSRNHVRGFKNQDGVEVVAVADTNMERVENLIREEDLDAKGHADYDDMIAGGGLDAVTIVTPNFLHEPMTLDAANAGLDVLCEKPMAPTVDACDRMIEAADKNDRILMVNQSQRYNGLYVRMRDMIKAGEIGDVFHVRMIRFGMKTPNKGWSPGADWFVDKNAGGGMTNDIGIHLIDYMNWCFGEVENVWGTARSLGEGHTADDNVAAIIQYKDGPNVMISLSWTAAIGRTYTEFFGTKGNMQGEGSKISVIRPGEEEPKLIEAPRDSSPETSYEHFIRCVRERCEPLSCGREAKRAIEVTNAIHAGK